MRADQDQLARSDKKSPPKVNNKAYFFILAIAALLATNVYFYIKFKSSGEKLYTVTLQRENLQEEIDRIEAELDYIKNQGIEYSVDYQTIENSVRTTIENLREHLEQSDLSEEELFAAKTQVAQLKDDVSSFKDEVTALRIRNELLVQEKAELNQQLNRTQEEVDKLQASQHVLNDKVSKASSIKVSNVHINGVEVKRNGTTDFNVRAKRVDRLQISFTIADNPVAEVGPKEVYVRVINPNGNLIANAEDIFYVHGEKLQYTFKENINFTNNGEEYQFLWHGDGQGFRKGAYTILLYADNAIMGRSSIVLK